MNEGSKLLLTVPEAALRLGVGRSFLYELILKGQVASLKLGRARRVPVAALEDFIARRLAEHEDGSDA